MAVGQVAEGRPHERLVRRADDYMRGHLGDPLSVLGLCREVGVSERTLHYAFQEVRGLSPMAYFRAHRLNTVRQELKASPAGTATVREISQRWGFWHTGEFASAYRRLFGELPSQTFDVPDHAPLLQRKSKRRIGAENT